MKALLSLRLSRKVLLASGIVFLAALFIFAAEFRNSFSPTVQRMKSILDPLSACSPAITYSLEKLDPRFGITNEELARLSESAAAVWNSALPNDVLTRIDKGGSIKINLIYDYRQEATNELNRIGNDIRLDAATYDSYKEKYSDLTSRYYMRRSTYDSLFSEYEISRKAYEEKIRSYADLSEISDDEYAKLEADRQEINSLANEVNDMHDELSEQIQVINQTATILNRLAKDLNLSAERYNAVGSSTGTEFDEGEYMRDSSGRRINIYQFESKTKLLRVLAHEFGHSIGMDHATATDSIMHERNVSNDLTLSTADKAELYSICGLDKMNMAYLAR